MKRPVALLLFGFSMFAAGAWVGSVGMQLSTKDIHPDISLAWHAIKTMHPDGPIDDSALTHGALKGMAESLNDPYSRYLAPEEAKQEEEELSGKFAGVGMMFSANDDACVVSEVVDGAPAEHAGIRKGDVLIAVDGTSTKDLPMEKVIKMVRGEEGTKVVLSMRRRDGSVDKLSVTRAIVTIETVTYALRTVNGTPLAVIAIKSFNDETVPQFNIAAASAIGQGAQAVVVDLRDNPGGYLHAALAVACRWTGWQTTIVERERGKAPKEDHVSCAPLFDDIRTVALINGNSASAAEILAGALQDYGKAIILGEKSFGKGIAQFVIPFVDGGRLHLTSMHWYTPKDRSIHKKGIVPDIVVPSSNDPHSDADPQLDAALNLLTKPR